METVLFVPIAGMNAPGSDCLYPLCTEGVRVATIGTYRMDKQMTLIVGIQTHGVSHGNVLTDLGHVPVDDYMDLAMPLTYWGLHSISRSNAPDTYRVQWTDEDSGEALTAHIHASEFAKAIALISTSKFVDYDGTVKHLANTYMVQAATDIINDWDMADFDSEFDDMVLQMAVFGKVIFG